MQIIVVNNGGSELSKPKFNSCCSVLENPRNPGFAHACNVGAATAVGEHLLFLNPDAVASVNDLETLLAEAIAHPEYAALSCRQTDSQGRWGITMNMQQGELSVTFKDIRTGELYLTKSFQQQFAQNQLY